MVTYSALWVHLKDVTSSLCLHFCELRFKIAPILQYNITQYLCMYWSWVGQPNIFWFSPILDLRKTLHHSVVMWSGHMYFRSKHVEGACMRYGWNCVCRGDELTTVTFSPEGNTHTTALYKSHVHAHINIIIMLFSTGGEYWTLQIHKSAKMGGINKWLVVTLMLLHHNTYLYGHVPLYLYTKKKPHATHYWYIHTYARRGRS